MIKLHDQHGLWKELEELRNDCCRRDAEGSQKIVVFMLRPYPTLSLGTERHPRHNDLTQ